MHDFTPVHALIGGAFIGLSLAILLVTTGRVAGMSGIIAGVVVPVGDGPWRLWFGAGMLSVGLLYRFVEPATFDYTHRMPTWIVAIGGVLVGLGTRLANGCTSGHGLCGIGRLSKRSIIATAVFLGVAILTATIAGTILRSAS